LEVLHSNSEIVTLAVLNINGAKCKQYLTLKTVSNLVSASEPQVPPLLPPQVRTLSLPGSLGSTFITSPRHDK
jgi:hypothetical protein